MTASKPLSVLGSSRVSAVPLIIAGRGWERRG
jgi:hypothetical protein